MTRFNYTPLPEASANAMLALQEWSHQQRIGLMNKIMDTHGEQRDGYQLMTVDFIPPTVSKEHWHGEPYLQVIGRADNGAFFSFEEKAANVEGVLAGMNIHYYARDKGTQALHDLKISTHYATGESPHPLKAVLDHFYYRSLYPAIARGLHEHLPFVPYGDDQSLCNEEAPFEPFKSVRKYRHMDYSGNSGKPITYGLSTGGSGHDPDDILERTCNQIESEREAAKGSPSR